MAFGFDSDMDFRDAVDKQRARIREMSDRIRETQEAQYRDISGPVRDYERDRKPSLYSSLLGAPAPSSHSLVPLPLLTQSGVSQPTYSTLPVPSQTDLPTTWTPTPPPPSGSTDIDFLRGGPTEVPYEKTATERLIGDVENLRREPFTNEYEQAVLARADEMVADRYNVLRQQKAQDLARRGMDPRSGLYQREMRLVDEAQARELADARRNLSLQKLNAHQQNLQQARSLEQAIVASQWRPLSEMERRQAAARGIEMQADQMERQRMADLLAMISGNPNYAGAAGASAADLARLYGQQGAYAQAGAAQSYNNIGDLIAAYLNRQPTTVQLPGQPAPAPAAPAYAPRPLPSYDYDPNMPGRPYSYPYPYPI